MNHARDSAEELRSRLRSLRVFEGELPVFDPAGAPRDPADLFLKWLVDAIDAGVREPHAMTLSTVDESGRPSSRILILKGLGDGRWEFATSALSRKGRELEANRWAALGFYWAERGRQVRIRGRVISTGPERAAADFKARSPEARIEAIAGGQSEVIDGPAALEHDRAAASARLGEEPGFVPPDWTVYALIPDEVEFWQAHPGRRHLRLRYLLEDRSWRQEWLAP